MLVAAVVLFSSAGAQAQCTMDKDCKGDRVCEAGQCTTPADEAEVPPADTPAAGAAAPAPQPDVRFFDDDEQPRKVKKRLTSPGMMAGGIVLTSAGPIFLMVGVLTTHCSYESRLDGSCNAGTRLLAFGLGAAALVGVGIPLIVMGAKRVPARHVALAPWLSPEHAGLQLHLEL